MPPYVLTIRLRLELADDAEARRLVGPLREIAEGALHRLDISWSTATAKLQRLYDDRPPRLIAKWPSE